jgi:hypothetical protein
MAANVAVTDCVEFIVAEQVVAAPLQAPLHPENVEPPAGVAVSVTTVPEVRVTLQVVPHEMPPLDEVIVPPPGPAAVSDSVYPDEGGGGEGGGGEGGVGGGAGGAPSTYSNLSGSPQHSDSAPLVVAASSAVHACAGVALGLLCR